MFLVVGESLVDVVLTPDGAESDSPGGSPMNVAVGLSRLDVPTRLVTELGDDAHGRLVVDHLADSGVELAPGCVVRGRRTSTATARLDPAGAASYEFDLAWTLAAQPLPADVDGLHVGSLGTALEPGREAVLGLVREARAAGLFVSYDPNVRPAFPTRWDDVAAVAALARVVKLSDEDVTLLRPGSAPEDVARDLLAAPGTDLVVVTLGGAGAVGFAGPTRVDVAAPATDVVDTVGAGDSFMAGLVGVLLSWGASRDLDADLLRVLLDSAARAASVTVGRRGANPPTRRELPPDWATR